MTQIGFSKVMWWVVFLVATVALSLFFRTFKAFTLTPTLNSAFPCILATLLLFASFLVLIYDSYIKERVKGKIQRPLKLFDRIFARQYPAISPPNPLTPEKYHGADEPQ